MRNETIIIIILSLIIIGLVSAIYGGKSNFDSVIESLRIERISAIRSNGIIKKELEKSRGYNQELEKDNIELESIVDQLTAGSEKTKQHLNEYGSINRDFAEFIKQAEITD